MRPSSIRYYFKEGVTSLLRNRLMTVASVATVAACLLIVAFSWCLISNLNSILAQIEENIGINVFLDDDVDAAEITRIRDEMIQLPHVADVIYVSPEEGLENLKEELEMGDILDGFEGENNPLSHAFTVTLDSIENQDTVLSELEQIAGVRNISAAQTETDILLRINRIIGIVGVTAVLVLAVISVVIIMNTIKLSVYTRRTEINIMKYVGATDWFIRWPFIIEGTLIGVLGAVIPLVISYFAYEKAVQVLNDYLPMVQNLVTFLDVSSIFVVLLPVLLVCGILLGVFGSVSSIRKYLQV
ncbi:MAG TPA: permease-like cell division protein FtsX [Firmicutes bacterium]|nr:permease-like cell division protein FtsX [Bacillota bacterium]